jgi:hypothetical protein
MRRVALLLAAMALALLRASGVAWAVNKKGTNGPDTLRGTNGADNLLATAATTSSTPSMAATICWAGRARIASSALLKHSTSSRATRSFLEVPATISFGLARVRTMWLAGKVTTFCSMAA